MTPSEPLRDAAEENCPRDLHFRRECDDSQFKCGARISWKEGFLAGAEFAEKRWAEERVKTLEDVADIARGVMGSLGKESVFHEALAKLDQLEGEKMTTFKLETHIIGKVYDLTQDNMNAMIGAVEKLDYQWKAARRKYPGLHFCYDWDEMLIENSDPEYDSCGCFKRSLK